mmetsp:Transcript_27906/g.50543  ORF Transcript_27906/g.50543 Transcript_27906/m.50543 type:complete len:107 (+) Transcript_27906:1160-1480(+)
MMHGDGRNLKMFNESEGVESKESHLSLGTIAIEARRMMHDVMTKSGDDKSPLVYDVYTPPYLSLAIYLTEEGLHTVRQKCGAVFPSPTGANNVDGAGAPRFTFTTT